MPTDDERLLAGEVRRALERLRRIGEIIDELRGHDVLTDDEYGRLRALVREDQG